MNRIWDLNAQNFWQREIEWKTLSWLTVCMNWQLQRIVHVVYDKLDPWSPDDLRLAPSRPSIHSGLYPNRKFFLETRRCHQNLSATREKSIFFSLELLMKKFYSLPNFIVQIHTKRWACWKWRWRRKFVTNLRWCIIHWTNFTFQQTNYFV